MARARIRLYDFGGSMAVCDDQLYRLPRLFQFVSRQPTQRGARVIHNRGKPGTEQLRIYLFKGCWKGRLHELVRDFADPSLQLCGAAIPISDDVVHVAHEDRVVREVEEASLLAQGFERLAPFGHQASNDQRGSQEGNQCHEVQRVAQRYIYIETRLSKEVVQT